MRKMEEEIFVANSKGDVKALGMKINCAATDLHIYVNGVARAEISSWGAFNDKYVSAGYGVNTTIDHHVFVTCALVCLETEIEKSFRRISDRSITVKGILARTTTAETMFNPHSYRYRDSSL
jgi:hypothetical protein